MAGGLMGCDIHIHVEIKVCGEWLHVDPPRSLCWVLDDDPSEWKGVRDYAAFGLMAGVRTDVPPKYPPRGVPEDASPRTLAADMSDAHTSSWLTYDDLKDLGVCPLVSGHNCADADLRYYMGHMASTGLQVRIVFWFDN